MAGCVKVLGIDPGTDSPGFAVWDTDTAYGRGAIIWAAPQPPPFACDVVVVEAGWPHGPMGKVQMWGLGFRAAWQMRDCLDGSPSARAFTIQPKTWRAALGILSNPPKAVIVARLRELRYKAYVQAASGVDGGWTDDIEARLRELRYKAYMQAATGVDGGWTDDVVEACGIAEATAIVLGRQFKKDRKGLTEVVRTEVKR